MDADRDRCLASGMDHYISKPISVAQLDALLDSVLGARAEQA